MEEDELLKKNRKLKKQIKKLKDELDGIKKPAGDISLSQVEDAAIEPVKSTDDEYERLRIRHTGGRVWWQVGLGGALAVLAIFMMMLYINSSNNVLIGIMFIGCGAGAFAFVFMGLQKRDEGMFFKPSKKKVLCEVCEQAYTPGKQHDECPHNKIVPNCLNIYYGWDEDKSKYFCDRILFEEMKKSEIVSKHPQRCLDDGKYYYVQIHDGKNDKWMPFFIPDKTYYSPKEFPNALQGPMTRKVLRPKPTLADKVKPLVIFGILGIEVFVMLLQSSPPGG